METKRTDGDAKREAKISKVAAGIAKTRLAAAKKIDADTAKAAADQKKEMAKLVRKDAALAQKEPEDFSADEKQAAQAVINTARATEVATNEKTLADDIKTKEQDKLDFIDSFRSASHEAIGGVIEKQEKKLETSREKRAKEEAKRRKEDTKK